MRTPSSPADIADAVIAAVGKNIVLGLPVGIGKAIHVADALFERAQADPSISLSIFTGLTLEVPGGSNELERRFLAPLAERLYAGWPTPRYALAVRNGSLPPNIQVREFYLRPGAYLGNPGMQQNHASVNYSQVADELLRLGVNVIAQLVASRPDRPDRYSLSSNPEITLDLLPRMEERRRGGVPMAMVGQVNSAMPYMTGDAELERERFDFVLDDRQFDYPLFGLPNRPVEIADYAAAMHVASLVRDGGTLQIGIGSLSDAVAHCLRLRHEHPDVFGAVLRQLPGGPVSRSRRVPAQTGPFREGLYSSTELLSDALFSLFEAGIIRRAAVADDTAVIHAGFFIGSSKLYASLRELDDRRREQIRMSPVSFTNSLSGDEEQKRRQRYAASFINETMIVTLLGAAISDSLEGARVVSGVGGQFDFVSMAQQLDAASSVLMVRACRLHDGKPQSNILWSYPEATVPRHHRDIFVSEYGIAETRGSTDKQVIDAMLQISDARFQDELAAAAKRAGKLPEDYLLAASSRDNTPETLRSIFEQDDIRPWFPDYPLGTELTATEQQLAGALLWLKNRGSGAWSIAATLLSSLVERNPGGWQAALERLGLEHASGLREHVLRALVRHALDRTATEKMKTEEQSA